MTDRELVEFAAKAAGIDHQGWDEGPFDPEYMNNGVPSLKVDGWWWNPLEVDTDAFRLAVTLGIYVRSDPDNGTQATPAYWRTPNGDRLTFLEEKGDDEFGAARRAIVRAAAAIGESKP